MPQPDIINVDIGRTEFDPTNHISAWHLNPLHPIWTKFGMNILIDPENNPVKEFLIFLKIQDGCHLSKIGFFQNFYSNMTFWLGIWIPFI